MKAQRSRRNAVNAVNLPPSVGVPKTLTDSPTEPLPSAASNRAEAVLGSPWADAGLATLVELTAAAKVPLRALTLSCTPMAVCTPMPACSTVLGSSMAFGCTDGRWVHRRVGASESAQARPVGRRWSSEQPPTAGLWLRCHIPENIRISLEYLGLQGQTRACQHHALIFWCNGQNSGSPPALGGGTLWCH